MSHVQQSTPDTISLFELIQDVPGHLLRIKQTMLDISYAIEETAAEAGNCHLFVSFQRFSRFRPQFERYRRLSPHWGHCWIFGVADAEVPVLPNVTVVPIAPDSPLSHEWFVIADSPTFGSALLSADTSLGAIAARQYMGLWSADAQLVREASSTLATTLQSSPPTWAIDPAGTLSAYDRIANQFMVVHEERWLSTRPKSAPVPR